MTDAFDPAAKEEALRSESAAWDTSVPVPAEPGDIPTVDVGPFFDSGTRADLDAALPEVVAFLASEKSGYVTGQNIRVDGGLTNAV